MDAWACGQQLTARGCRALRVRSRRNREEVEGRKCSERVESVHSLRPMIYRMSVTQVAEANNDKKSAQDGHKSEVDSVMSALCAHPPVLLSAKIHGTLPACTDSDDS